MYKRSEKSDHDLFNNHIARKHDGRKWTEEGEKTYNKHKKEMEEIEKEKEKKIFHSLTSMLKSVQNELFNLGTELAVAKGGNSNNLPRLSNDAILQLETEIDNMNESLAELTSFVLPGGSVLNAQFHMARNVCRRAERRTVTLSKNENIKPENIHYLNRLSDALFVWSRWISHILGNPENLWEPNY